MGYTLRATGGATASQVNKNKRWGARVPPATGAVNTAPFFMPSPLREALGYAALV